LARIGYDGIEIGCAAPHAWPRYLSQDRRHELKRIMDGEGLPAISLLPAPGGGPGFNGASPYGEERRATIDHYKEVVDLASDLGAGLVLYIAGWQIFGTSRLDAWKYSQEALVEIAIHAAERGITIVVEPTSADSNLVETADDALEMMRGTQQANVKVMFDTYHAIYRNEVSADYVRTMGRNLAHIHCADTDRAAPGDGRVDWRGVMQALKDVGFAGYLTMEVGFHTRAADPDLYAARSLAFLKQLESELG
jgi:protein FrlC